MRWDSSFVLKEILEKIEKKNIPLLGFDSKCGNNVSIFDQSQYSETRTLC